VPAPPVWVLFGAAALYNVVAGFNSGGNLMGSFVAARAFTLGGAGLVLLAGAALGPWVVGTAVAHSIVFAVVALPGLGARAYLAAVLAALAVLAICWWRALPTNATLALVGALAGTGLAAAGPGGVVWSQVWKVFASMLAALAIGAATGVLAWALLRAVLRHADEGATGALRGLQAVTGLLQGFAYGSNDAEKAMGLFALLAAWGSASGRAALAAGSLPVPAWAVWTALATFGAGMALGGARIARTVGGRFFPVRARDALAAQLAAGLTVIAAAAAGGPVSSTQTATAALRPAGAARRASLPRWSLVTRMAMAWAVTLPLALALGAALYALGTVA
jgi:PiT family inorganic phosphate transporter